MDGSTRPRSRRGCSQPRQKPIYARPPRGTCLPLTVRLWRRRARRFCRPAESVILDSGGRTFTLDAVAERAGISKGGLVYSFATKDGLVRAALEREVSRFQDAVRQRLGDKPVDPFEIVLAHIEEALDEDDATTRKAAFLVTALVHAPDMMEPARRYYRTLLDPLLSKSGDAHDVRHALLAIEGLFLLRGLGFVEFSAEEHRSVLLHARDIVIAVLAKHRAFARNALGPK